MGLDNMKTPPPPSQSPKPVKPKKMKSKKQKKMDPETVLNVQQQLLQAQQNIEANSIMPNHLKRNFKEMFDYHFPDMRKQGFPRTQEGLMIEDNGVYEMTFTEACESPNDLQYRLMKHGLVIVTGVINEEKNAKIVKSYVQDFAHLVDSKHYVDGKAPHPSTVAPKGWGGKTILSENGMPCTKNAQKRRLNSRVRELFSRAYGVMPNDLITSMEGPAVQFSRWVKHKGGQSTNGMSSAAAIVCAMSGKNQAPIHCGNPNGPNAKAYKRIRKSSLAFTEPLFGAIINKAQEFKVVNAGKRNERYLTSPGLIFCPGRKVSQEFQNTDETHWTTFTHTELMEMIPNIIFPCIPAGSVVLWRWDTPVNDSLGHKAFLAGTKDSDVVRACQYVSWFPKAFVNPEVIQARVNSAYQGIGDRGSFPGAYYPATKGRHRSNTNGDWKILIDTPNRHISDDMLRALGADVYDHKEYERNLA